MKEGIFVLDSHPHQGKIVAGRIKHIESIAISHARIGSDPYYHLATAVTLNVGDKTHQFGFHLTNAEKEWIVSEMCLYLQENRQPDIKR